jgi:hypothetical protein
MNYEAQSSDITRSHKDLSAELNILIPVEAPSAALSVIIVETLMFSLSNPLIASALKGYFWTTDNCIFEKNIACIDAWRHGTEAGIKINAVKTSKHWHIQHCPGQPSVAAWQEKPQTETNNRTI